MSASSISDNVPLLSLSQTTTVIPPATEYRSPSIQLGHYSALSLHFQASTDCSVAFENSPNGKDWFTATVHVVPAGTKKQTTVNIQYKWTRLYIRNNDLVNSTVDKLQVFVYGITSPPSILPAIEKVLKNNGLQTFSSPAQRNTSKQILTSYVFDHGYSGFPLSYPPACPYYFCPPLGNPPVAADPFPANPSAEQRAKTPYSDIFFYVAYPEGYVPPIIDHPPQTGYARVTVFPEGLGQKSQAQSYTKLNYIAPLPGNPPILQRKPYLSFEQTANAITFQERLNGNTDGPDYDMNRITVMTGIPFNPSSAAGRVGCYFTSVYNQAEKDVARTNVTQMLVGMADFIDNPLRPLNNTPYDSPPYASKQEGVAWWNTQSPGDSSEAYYYEDPLFDPRRYSPGQTSGAAFGYYSNVDNDQPEKDFRVYISPTTFFENHKVTFDSSNPSLSFGIAVWNASSAHFFLTSAWEFDHADGTGQLPSLDFQEKNSFQIEYDPSTESYFFYIQSPSSKTEDDFILVHAVSNIPPSTSNFSPLATFGHYNSFESWDNGASSLILHNYTSYTTGPSSASDPNRPLFKRSLYTITQNVDVLKTLAGSNYSSPVPVISLVPDPSASFWPPIYEKNFNDPAKNIDTILPKTTSRQMSIAAVSFSCTVPNNTILLRIVGRKRWNYNVLLHPSESYVGNGIAQYTVSNTQSWATSLPARLLIADGRHLTFVNSNSQPINTAAFEPLVYGEFLLAQGFHTVVKTFQELSGQQCLDMDPRIDTLSLEIACPQAETVTDIRISVNVLY